MSVMGIVWMIVIGFVVGLLARFFYPGAINPKDYMDALQVDEAEYELIRNPDRGVCLYRCGGERYYLQVQVPDYKEALFGKAGGR